MSKRLDELDRKLMGVAVMAASAGIGVLVPGVFDTIAEGVNSFFSLNLDLGVPAWVGWALLSIGFVLGLVVYASARGWITMKSSKFMAVTHTSFPTPSPTLDREVANSSRDTVVARVFDLSAFFRAGLDVEGALRQQSLMVDDIRAAQRARDTICYGGMVHIPLQFHLGSAISTGSGIRFFEKNRNTNAWEELIDRSPSLGATTEWTLAGAPTHAVVRVSISYLIAESAIESLVDVNCIQAHVAIPAPTLDCVSSYSQLDELSTEFRRVMDRLQTLLPRGAEVHVMFAGPACIGVSLGRQISHNVHNATYVYNYHGQSNPPYTWSVLVNSATPAVRMPGVRS